MATPKSNEPELEIFTVARGRTVITDDGSCGPGEQVLLSPAEGARLRSMGFLLLENGNIHVNVDGPKVINGDEIVEKA